MLVFIARRCRTRKSILSFNVGCFTRYVASNARSQKGYQGWKIVEITEIPCAVGRCLAMLITLLCRLLVLCLAARLFLSATG